MPRPKESSCESLFSTTGELKHKVKLSPFFLRKPYQYTIAEPNDNDQQRIHEYDYLKD